MQFANGGGKYLSFYGLGKESVSMSINTKAEFDVIIDRIGQLVEAYEKDIRHYNEYLFYLANGDKLAFNIAPQSIAHLLGIKTDYLKATGIFKSQDSYGLLKELLYHSYSVYQNVQNGHLAYNKIFSDCLEEKLEAFQNVIYYYNPNNIEFVCKYDKSRNYQSGKVKDYLCNYFIAKKNENGDLFLLGLLQQDRRYYPMSSMLFPKDELQTEKLRQLFCNQVLTFSNSICCRNPSNSFEKKSNLNTTDTLNHIKILKKYGQYTDTVSIDTSFLHQFNIVGSQSKTEKLQAMKLICQQLAQTIPKQELFHLHQIDDEIKEQLPEDLMELIQNYNDSVCSNPSTTPASITYSNLLEQYKNLSIQVEVLKQQLEVSKQQIQQYYEQNLQLQMQNETYRAFQNEIFQVVETQKQKVIVE